MRAEEILLEEQNIANYTTSEAIKKKYSKRVDINDLLARVREEKNKENKVNIVFFGLFGSLILIVGIILSL